MACRDRSKQRGGTNSLRTSYKREALIALAASATSAISISAWCVDAQLLSKNGEPSVGAHGRAAGNDRSDDFCQRQEGVISELKVFPGPDSVGAHARKRAPVWSEIFAAWSKLHSQAL